MNIKKIVLRTVPYVCIALYGTKTVSYTHLTLPTT